MFGKRWPTRVVFIRDGREASMPIDLGFEAVMIGLGKQQVLIPAGETRYIAWPAGLDHVTWDGQPMARPQFWQVADEPPGRPARDAMLDGADG